VWYLTPLITHAVYERTRGSGWHASEYKSSSICVVPSYLNLVIYQSRTYTISEFEKVLYHELCSHEVEVAHT
jgi:hypothetical protein